MATKFDPQNAQNLVEIEKQFAVKVVEHAQTYWRLLARVNPRDLRLTSIDDEIYNDLMETFPELNQEPYEKLAKIDEEWMKNPEGKKRWAEFMNRYEKKVKDYNFGCLIRTEASGEYSELGTIFVQRMQFYAFEIARNRLGLNDPAHKIAQEDLEKEEAVKREKEEERKREAKKKGKK
ncbi:DUF757-domain-containing protein [Schizophyllum commune H4-8]|uniref:Polysaccharide biosynthesis domain-containing protein n=1 Tax=Schizophyllum commune (strain H4-8 / FGSC 9210) TaxID=578458 RepID=D8QM87_SCHCM|nr:DUF757-domain-containing protein [Schizophyllum commune H4-8]KAI5892966.1 DUF757-domain-containing protein [Schizophyllum commune H4-8]